MRILVVDDERSNLEEIEECLMRIDESIEIVLLTNPAAALEAVRTRDFDAAFLDIQMPGMTGLELAERIFDEKPAIETVFITAYNHYAAEAFEVNAVDYILKPIRLERVKKTFNKLAERMKRSETKQESKELSVHALGAARLLCGGEEIRWNRGRTGELFWFLLMHKGQKLHKELICETLWPEFESKQALANLQVTVCRLRKDLECFDRRQICIEYAGNCYCLVLGEGYYNVDEFNLLAETGSREALEKAAAIYEGGFLEREGWLWAGPKRERLRQKYNKAVERLEGIYIDAGDYYRAEMLLSDCLEKEIPQESLMKLYLRVSAQDAGKQGLARAYKNICEKYVKHLDMGIPAEIKREYARLSKGEIKNWSLKKSEKYKNKC